MPQATNDFLFSVVICTYNRANVLELALESICAQTFDPERFETIVVDNNSTDRTREAVESFRHKLKHLRCCVETAQGLSPARNRGFREARGKFVAYLDDDAKAPPHWLAHAAGAIAAQSPGALGGPFYPYYLGEKPRWYLDRFGSREVADSARPLRNIETETLSGGNFFIRRDLLEALGGFDARLGVKGVELGSGEETALQLKLFREFPAEKIYYDPELYILHLVRPDKISLAWKTKFYFNQGVFTYRTKNISMNFRSNLPRVLLQAALALGYLCYCFTLGGLLRDRKKWPYLLSYYYEEGLRPVHYFGRCREVLRQKFGPQRGN